MPNTIKELSILSVPKSDGTLQEYEIVDSALRQSVENNKPNWNAVEITDSESGEVTGYENGYISNKPAIKSGTGLKSIIENRGAEASAECAHAEGYSTIASARDAHAEGGMTVAKGTNSHAEGEGETLEVIISGEANSLTYTFENDITQHYLLSGELFLIDSSAESQIKIPITSIDIENKTIVLSETISQDAITSQTYYIAMVTTASGSTSHAEGSASVASGSFSHAEGRFALASEQVSHAEGYHTVASEVTSHAEGYFTTASGQASHAEGNTNTASGNNSHAEGYNNIASGANAHAEGYNNNVSTTSSHVEGASNTVSGDAGHAEGIGNTASGKYSHAEGQRNVASNYGSHAEGYYTVASGLFSHAEGYGAISQSLNSHAEGYNTTTSSGIAHAEGVLTTATGYGAHSEGYGNRFALQLTGDGNTLTYTYTSDMPKYIIKHLQNNGAVKLITTPNGSWTWNFNQNHANYHCANVTAIDEENKTVTVDVTLSEDAISNRFCWFLLLNTSSGTGSHAEGVSTIVSGAGSHADGQYTFVSGHASSASGECTIASTSGQTVIGTYNIPDDTTTNLHPSQYSGFGKYAFIVGNGYDTGGTSNAHTLDWQGNGWYAGKLTVGSAPTNNMDVATKQYVDNHSTPVTASSITSALGYTPANPSNIPTFDYVDVQATDIFTAEITKPTFIATDSMSKNVMQTVFGIDAPIIVPSDITDLQTLVYRLNPRTWFVWLNGTEVEFARLNVSLNGANNAVTMYLRGRVSTKSGIMGVDSAWTVTPISDFTDAYKNKVDSLWTDYQSAFTAMGL